MAKPYQIRGQDARAGRLEARPTTGFDAALPTLTRAGISLALSRFFC